MQLTLERGTEPREVVPVIALAARAARAKKLPALIVVSGLEDPADAAAISAALDAIRAGDAMPTLKIAFVACTYPQYSVYHFAEGYAQRLGFTAKVLVSVREARDWLGLAKRVGESNGSGLAGLGRARRQAQQGQRAVDELA